MAPVVAGVDGSASSLAAVRLAAGHAASYGSPLLIVHAFNWLPRQRLPAGTCPRAAADDVIGRAAAAARDVAPGLEIGTRLLEGAATSTLLRLARTAVLLAVGGGLSTQDCLATYTSAVHIAARAPCSVLVARASPPSSGPILVGVNGAPASEQALDVAFDIAARRRTELVVVRAAPPGRAGDEEQLRDLVRPREDRYHLTARIRLLPGEPEVVLVAASAGAGLVVVGARGRRPYQGLLGPVAQTLLQHSPAPVLLVRGGVPVQERGPGHPPPATATPPRPGTPAVPDPPFLRRRRTHDRGAYDDRTTPERECRAGVRPPAHHCRRPPHGATAGAARALPCHAADLATALLRGGLEPSGPPIAIIRPDDTGAFQVTVGSPVRWCPATGPPLVHDRTPEGPAVQLLHFGAPDTLLATYDRLNEWLTARRIPPVPLMWEEYLVSGAATDDTAAWRTRIVLPLPPHAAAAGGGSRADGP